MRTIEEIFSLYANDVFRYVNSYVRNKYIAEDILQDTFYKAYIALDAYSGENVIVSILNLSINYHP
ncbi:sigma factor [Heyndrickxia coagulans]|uniref:sigma factor n=1 Tax=Heyndrickxia coagulans TaxID=1398 RepID=UPI0023E3D9CE|nr:sigma factor [Heyndrickxia coagulans]